MASLSQDTRIGAFQTVLGKDKLGLTKFEGHEGLSELFEYQVECVSDEKGVIDFSKHLGSECHVSIQTNYKGVKRHFHGMMMDARFISKEPGEQQGEPGLTTYLLTMRPWLWFLTHTSNCRIFSEKSVDEIIEKVLGKYGFAKFEMRFNDSFPKIEYCVQYRESDFAFVCRLMEEYGIYYHFEHSEEKHLMVMAKGASDQKRKEGKFEMPFYALDVTGLHLEDALTEFTPGQSFKAAQVALIDYDYKKPTAKLDIFAVGSTNYDNHNLELYDYPGGYTQEKEGQDLGLTRLSAEQGAETTANAVGDALTCVPGKIFKLTGHPVDAFNKQYLVRRAQHSYQSQSYHSGSSQGEERYSGHYEVQQQTVFHPPFVTQKPVIPGPQTAFVASEMDDQSRVDVIFHWERDKKHSRYVRIGQGWAGAGWGDFKIPRIGMEVIVEFLNGDPDYPLITGCVYNGDNKPPYDTPTKSGTKSQNYHSGSGYNELMFDDKDDAQLIRLHAQKDMEGVIEEKETRSIGIDSSLTIGNKAEITIGNSRTESIGMNSTLTVGSALTETIGMNWTVTSGASISFICGASSIMMTPAGIVITSPNILMNASAAMAVTTGSAFALTSGGAVAITAAAAIAITAAGPAVFHGLPPIVA
jgi:type VI secretion system secreted protein VgrG